MVAVFLSSLAHADGWGHLAQTQEWIIESSEQLNEGTRGDGRYPVWQLVDNNPRTAWVYRAKDYPLGQQSRKPSGESLWIKFEPASARWIDEIRIRPGYQKSKELWSLNSRPVQIQIFDRHPREWDEFGSEVTVKPMRTVDLRDAMDEKSIWIPRRKYNVLYVAFSCVKRGAVDDLCVSELAPRSGGRDIVSLPAAFLHSDGSDCGCGGSYWLTTRSGRPIAEADYEYPRIEFSPNRDLVAGVKHDKRGVLIWVGDLLAGSVVWSRRIPKSEQVGEVKWTGRRRLAVTYGHYGRLEKDSMPWIQKGAFRAAF